jgi:hypothetical protein
MNETFRPFETSNLRNFERGRESVEGSKGRRFEHSRGLGYLAPVGERLTFTARVEKVRGTSNQFGAHWRVWLSSGGYDLFWMSSSELAALTFKGKLLTLTGTVKAHELGPQGQQVTVMTRCVLADSNARPSGERGKE